MVLPARPDLSVFERRKTKTDFDREREEFDARRRARQMQEQMGQLQIEQLQQGLRRGERELETGILGSMPAAERLARTYMEAKRTGNEELANALESFAKTREKNVMFNPQTGQYEALPGLGGALGQLEFGKSFGGQQAVEQVKSAFEPQREMEKAAARAVGAERGEQQVQLTQLTSRMPQLMSMVDNLSALGQKATYTGAGLAKDFLREQAGLEPSERSIARTEYISRVYNEILPLLRQTFGAQFTEKEGESLKATLGSPNVAPAKKDAVLRSFIQTKKANANSAARALGQPLPYPGIEPSDALFDFENLERLDNRGSAKAADFDRGQPVKQMQDSEVERLLDLYAQ